MFRLAPIVLLAAALSSVAFAQKNPTKQDANGNGVVNAPSENGSTGTVNADAAAAAAKPEPLPFAGSAYLELSAHDKMMHAFVHGAEPGFVGVVGLSLTPDLAHSFTGLPPLLVDAVVVAYGFTKTQDLELSWPLFTMPAESIQVYGQAVVLDEQGIWASGIVPLVIGQANGDQPVNGVQTNADLPPKPAAH
ncbi:MAG TPA: hypothetical protein VFD82_04890 [Planctomycetota bacterium]|nr:hypothetical protein [Planctomycetota bacterium]